MNLRFSAFCVRRTRACSETARAVPACFGRWEDLSWNPATLPRAAFILARLAQAEINDNWVNKPTHSLESIFRAWMPQTAASHQICVDLMKKLADRFS